MRPSLVRPAGALSLLAPLVLPLSCGPGDGAPGAASIPPAPASRAALDAPIAVRITDDAQLIGGPRADGKVGDYLLDNGVIHLIVQDIGRGLAFHPLGGDLIDADVVRPAGAPGADLLGETMTAINLRTLLKPEAVVITMSGQPGQPARLKVTGVTESFPLFPPREPIPALGLEVDEEYVLEPEAHHVEIRTTFTNPTDRSVTLDCGDLLFFGTHLTLSSAGNPYGEGVGQVAYLTAHHDTLEGASYGWRSRSGEMIVPFEDASQTGAIHPPRRLDPGQSRTCVRQLIVGDRDSASVTDAIFALEGGSVGEVTGLVRLSDGSIAAGAQARIFTPEGGYVTDARTQGDSPFTADVPPGGYAVQWVLPDGRALEPVSVTVRAGGSADASGQASAPGRAAVACTDGSLPMPCRVVAEGPVGRSFHFTETGALPLTLAPGHWRLTVSRGMERALVVKEVDVASGQSLAVPVALPRVIDTDGWVSMDSHLHAIRSNDSGTPLTEKVRELVGEGVEVAVSTEHDRISDYGPAARALGVDSLLKTVVGDEVSVIDYGHFNAFPLSPDPADPTGLDGSQLWMETDPVRGLSASELFARLRGLPGERIVQINHPRDGAKGYLSMIAYDAQRGRGLRERLATDFDTLEVQTSVFGDDAVILDLFSFLNKGLTPTAVGSSDAHQADDYNGMPCTWVKVDDDDPATLTDAALVAALKSQAATVSSGIFGEISATNAAGQSVDRPGATLTGRGGPVLFEAALTAPGWASIGTFVLFENGVPLGLVEGEGGVYEVVEGAQSEIPLSPTLVGGRWEAELAVSVAPRRDAHYVLLAWGTQGQPLSGHLPILVTNPIYVDREGDGWEPPGAAARIGPAPRWPDVGPVNHTGH